MKIAKPIVLSFSVLAFASAWAQQPQEQSQQQQSQQESSAAAGASQQSASQMSADQLIDSKVMDSQGEELGEIKDVVLDLQGGKIHAVELEIGGTAGVGAKKFAFPANEIKPGQNRGQFTVDAQKQKLENGEGYAKGQWPQLGAEYWGKEGQAGAGGTQGGAQKANLKRVSEMKGKEVSDKSGQEVGEIKDVTVDLTSGQVRNYIVSVKDGGQAQVQPSALGAGADDKLVLNMDAQQLKQQAQQSRQRGSAGSGASSGQQQGGSQQR
jgi:sporulation protein YlmC with PRC-barrel domain